jgi:hypothetical protein
MKDSQAAVESIDLPDDLEIDLPLADPEKEATLASTSLSDANAAPATSGVATLIFFALVVVALYVGWRMQAEELLTAESGLGYALGIVGSVLMLLLWLYSARKNLRFMRRWGAVKHWYRGHMALGVLGPVFILFHANFRLGSLNSRVVLASTLVVMGSGLVGAYIYRKINHGLYGELANLKDLQEEARVIRESSMFVVGFTPELQDRLLAFQTAILTPPQGVLHSVGRLLTVGLWTRWNHFVALLVLRRTLRDAARRAGWSARERRRQGRAARRHIAAHLNTVLRNAEFSFYERLFALWHLFHLPLFVMLLITGVVHVLAVHMY